jgi:hypothetical protein|tara:strand:- start:198 stop:554 length:357 start_codon:yes stop_codon:yes gene_type:complete
MSLNISYQGVSLSGEGILVEVITQLNKDLTLSGIEYEFDIDSEKDKFIIILLNWIETTLSENEHILFNFLYRVDVDQQLIYSNDGLPQENLLKLILNRELQKVVLKRQYSSGSDSLLS